MCTLEKPDIQILQKNEQCLEDGIHLITMTYARADGTTFTAFAITADPAKTYLLTGTADCGYGTIDCTAFVWDHLASVRKEGHDAVAAINSGYFRRKDHCRPYGLSIRNGIEIAPPYSEPRLTTGNIVLGRRWLGMAADHSLLIGDDENYHEFKDQLVFATSYTHFLVENGEINYGINTPNTAPRTTFALRKDGTYIFSVIDGRQPDYSVGATLLENAQMMIDLGAETAFHLDGGGSTNLCICDTEGQIVSVNRPSEQRKVFDTLILARRPKNAE